MQMTCQECGTQFEGRSSAKYCHPCRPEMHRRQVRKNNRKKARNKGVNTCNRCQKPIVPFKRYCTDCKYEDAKCLFCGNVYKRVVYKRKQQFCSQKCMWSFFSKSHIMKLYEKVKELESFSALWHQIVDLKERLGKLEERYNLSQTLLAGQEITTSEMIEQNERLRERVREMNILLDPLPSVTTYRKPEQGKYTNRTKRRE